MAAGARNARIDWMRVAAIVVILLYHSDDYGYQYWHATPQLALTVDMLVWASLALFFSLSGYLTRGSSARESTTGWQHLSRRFARLYIPFAIALVLFKVLGVIALDWPDVFLNLALLGPWVGPDVLTLWFVEVLIFYHVAYSLWLYLRGLRGSAWTIPVFVGAVTLAAGFAGWRLGTHVDPRVAAYCGDVRGRRCARGHAAATGPIALAGAAASSGRRWRPS